MRKSLVFIGLITTFYGTPFLPGLAFGEGPAALAPPSPSATVEDPSPVDAVSPAQPPTVGLERVDPRTGSSEPPGALLGGVDEALDQLEARTGLRVGLAFTTVGQFATGAGDNRDAGAGDLDLMLRWNLVGRGTDNPGTLVLNSEYRFQIGDLPPSALASEIGVGIPTTNGFSERPPVIKDLYWVQHLFEGALRFGVGRADPENLVGGHKLQSGNTFFLHKAFSGNPAIAFPGSGFAAAAGLRPSDRWYISVGAANAYGQTTRIEFESLVDEWDLFSFVEAGLTPTFTGAGAGRYRVAAWQLDQRSSPPGPEAPSDAGVSVIADQEFGERWTFFARYAWSEADVTGVAHLVEAGGTCTGLLGRESLTGLAVAYADYSAAGRRDETIGEVFQRWQVTRLSQFTLGAQVIFEPADRPNDDVIGVLSVRLRVSL